MAIPNTYNSGVFPEEYSTALQARLNKPVTFKDVAKVIYSNSYIINNPYMSTEFSDQTGTRGCSYSFSEFALTNDTLTISSLKHCPVFIDQADLAQMTLLGQTEVAERQGKRLLDVVETAMLADHGSWTDFDNATIGGAAGNITVSASNVDNIIRGLKREIGEANGQGFLDQYGAFIVWRYADLEYLEEFAQQSGFQLADRALQNGIKNAYDFMGITHYVSNSHAANHLFAGVKQIYRIGILQSTWGQFKVIQDPASGVSTYGPVSGIGINSRVDYGLDTPAGLITILFDVNVA